MITLQRASLEDAKAVHAMQVRAFQSLLEKYQDFPTNPAAEPLGKVEERLRDKDSSLYFICHEGDAVGGIRVQRKPDSYRVGILYILPEYQGRGYAQQAMALVEKLYSQALRWELDTILEEPKLCCLYEKLGYHKTGGTVELKPGMTLVNYEKTINKTEG